MGFGFRSRSYSSAVCFKVSGEANKHWICSREGNRRMPPHPIHSIRERDREKDAANDYEMEAKNEEEGGKKLEIPKKEE